MKIWIHVNGIQQGPYSKEQIEAMHLPAATPVWYEGLAQWLPACQAPELADLFGDNSGASAATIGENSSATNATFASGSATTAAAIAADIPPRPAAFLAWSIILTLCCCTPFSLAALVCGALTNMRYGRGDYDGARRMSRLTEWLVIISITLGIVSLPLSMVMML